MSKFAVGDKVQFQITDALGKLVWFDGVIIEKDASGEGLWRIQGGPGIFSGVHENRIRNV